jgi:hypothetical protein
MVDNDSHNQLSGYLLDGMILLIFSEKETYPPEDISKVSMLTLITALYHSGALS